MIFNPKILNNIVKKYGQTKSNLLAILIDIQTEYKWLPPEALKMIAEQLELPLIDVYSVASFYHAFSLTPRGKHIVTVCQGTACHVRGAPIILDRVQGKLGIKPGCTTKDDRFTLETVNCLGACALAPIVVVDGQYHGQTSIKKVDTILAQYQKAEKKVKLKKKSISKIKKKK
ncbi:NADH dehydrogenase [candidate division WOR-3 bacterium RBG_13_43_14]|uniref:NADH dehydrogenase n=1 Tax=candidate division WOR-3 bacterium RBG_13_43_14 TaxID=1802590 RepID=A0A1F4U6X8_UNCW3|nr:MAG: NADH dehydrogenase [candidate division WOR-3 bacterium RBG_13_43_14]